jgi:hypothetical protein
VTTALVKLLLGFLAKTITLAIVASVLLVLVVHFSLGIKSPGLIAIMKVASHFWIPLIAILCLGLPALFLVRVMWIARRQAIAMGLSTGQYFDKPQEQRERLVSEYRESKRAKC